MIALGVCKGWKLHHLDINNAFLHGFLEEEIYSKRSQGRRDWTSVQIEKKPTWIETGFKAMEHRTHQVPYSTWI